MIDDEDHPEMRKAQQGLMKRLGMIAYGQRVNKPLIDKLKEELKDHRASWRAQGVDFPQMVILAIPRLGVLDFARADLDIASIRIKIVNTVRMTPQATMQEIVEAFMAAYPDLKPDDVLKGHEDAKAADVRQRERQARIMQEARREVGIDDDDDVPPTVQ